MKREIILPPPSQRPLWIALAVLAALYVRMWAMTPSAGVMAISNNKVSKGTSAGAITDSSITDDGTTVSTAEVISFSSTKTNGTITLSSGTGTATVASGAKCVCTDTTAQNVVQCAVATTTLTASGIASDVIAYHCF